jgi:hypothetical protein
MFLHMAASNRSHRTDLTCPISRRRGLERLFSQGWLFDPSFSSLHSSGPCRIQIRSPWVAPCLNNFNKYISIGMGWNAYPTPFDFAFSAVQTAGWPPDAREPQAGTQAGRGRQAQTLVSRGFRRRASAPLQMLVAHLADPLSESGDIQRLVTCGCAHHTMVRLGARGQLHGFVIRHDPNRVDDPAAGSAGEGRTSPWLRCAAYWGRRWRRTLEKEVQDPRKARHRLTYDYSNRCQSTTLDLFFLLRSLRRSADNIRRFLRTLQNVFLAHWEPLGCAARHQAVSRHPRFDRERNRRKRV